MIRKIVFVLVAVFISTLVSAQDYKSEIKKDYKTYTDLLAKQEFSKAFEFITPDFFTYVPKEDLLNYYKQTYSNTEIAYSVDNYTIITTGKLNTIKGKSYVLLNTSAMVTIKVLGKQGEAQAKKEERAFQIKLIMEQLPGTKKVTLNETTYTITAIQQKKVYAISENGKTNWKFLDLEKDSVEIYSQILPEALVKELSK